VGSIEIISRLTLIETKKTHNQSVQWSVEASASLQFQLPLTFSFSSPKTAYVGRTTTRESMAQRLNDTEIVTQEELLISQVIQLDALTKVLVRGEGVRV
jgi:hypothetical protein